MGNLWSSEISHHSPPTDRWWISDVPSPNLQFASFIKNNPISTNIATEFEDIYTSEKYDNHCRFYGSAIGCRYGSQCKKSHKHVEFTEVCGFWESKNDGSGGCKYGKKCKYRHFLTEDELFNENVDKLRETLLYKKTIMFFPSVFSNSQLIDMGHCNITLLKPKQNDNKNKIFFHCKQRIMETWQHDLDLSMEGCIILDNYNKLKKESQNLKIITQQIWIKKTYYYHTTNMGNYHGGPGPTTKFETDYGIQQYWRQDLIHIFFFAFNDITNDIVNDILSYIGFPILYCKRVFFLMMDLFCFEAPIKPNKYKVDNLWDAADADLLSIFDNDFKGAFQLIQKKVKQYNLL